MNTAKIKKYILPTLPYIFVFWFFCKFGEEDRISNGADVIHRLTNTMISLNKVMANPMISLNIRDIFVGIFGAAGVYAIVYIRKKNAKKYRKDVEYGSARWGNKKDIEPFADLKSEKNIILTATESLTLNSRPKNPKYARNKNVLVIGGSGSGKTRFFVKPNIMQMHSSYVITDPKGQILVECGKLLQRNGYKIKVLNTIDFKKSMHYNPFSYIRSEKDILKFVTALIANTQGDQKGGDPFWVKSETLLYCALIGFIHYEASKYEKNLKI